MRILPVLDLMNGVVVRGVAGRRSEYRPLVSHLVGSSEPLAVARAYRDHFGLTEVYLADLDAIGSGAAHFEIYAVLVADGFRCWIDAGIRNTRPPSGDTLATLARLGIRDIVLGLETLESPDALRRIVQDVPPDRLIFSLDMKDGVPLGGEAWRESPPLDIVGAVVEHGISRLILLDLASVGVHQGPSTLKLCDAIRSTYAHVEITTGGGVRSVDDLRQLHRAGVDCVLVASALHDGSISRADLG